MRFSTLDQWLEWQSTLHPSEIELGLERVARVWARCHQGRFGPLVISVAGTNGKGSSVAFLEAILVAAGYRVGSYTSPHLLRYNERIRLDCEMVEDTTLCNAFERVDQARDDIALTYFEFGTLAALQIFVDAQPDVVLLEVGLGGRLDAVNIIDADLALITGIAIDHSDWLGDTLEQIAFEKAGIMRAGRPVVFSGQPLPEAIESNAKQLDAPLYVATRDFKYRTNNEGWQWQGGGSQRPALPLPRMRGAFQLANASGVLMALALLREQLPVDQQAVRTGLQQAVLPGRFQLLSGEPLTILDVAHNPQAAAALAANLQQIFCPGRRLALFSMLADKDITGVVKLVAPLVDHWYLTELQQPRAATIEALQEALLSAGVASEQISIEVDPERAPGVLRQAAGDQDQLLVFGSFHLAELALKRLDD